MSRITLGKSAPPPLDVKEAPFESAIRWHSRHEEGHVPARPNIFMGSRAFRGLNRHAASRLDLEVGGMLIGDAFYTPDDQWVVIVEGHLAARHVEHSAAHLTFTSRTLSDLHNRLEAELPGKRIVGWYHTHPGLGIFLSSMDLWLHMHFFPEAWHVALVIDPYVHYGGFFSYAADTADYINPKRYTGFYALAKPGQKSWMTWQNLSKRPADNDSAALAAAIREQEGYRYEP